MNQNRSPSEPYDVVSSDHLVEWCISLTEYVIKYYRELKISTPVLISCAILNGRGYFLPKGFGGFGFPKVSIDRDLIVTPTIMVNEFEQDAKMIFKPIFDSIWNAFGRTHCSAYNQSTGEYTGFNNNNEVIL